MGLLSLRLGGGLYGGWGWYGGHGWWPAARIGMAVTMAPPHVAGGGVRTTNGFHGGSMGGFHGSMGGGFHGGGMSGGRR